MGRRGLRRRGPYGVGDDEDGLPAPITLRQARHDAARHTLEADPRLRTAAIIASTFHLDPVDVLGESDRVKRLVRLAAHNVIQRELNRAAAPHR